MADNTVVDRYRRYKQGTKTLVEWLANTARGCRDVTSIVPSIRAAKDSAKQAKRKYKQGATTPATTVTLTTAQLVSLAKVVNEAAVAIPEYVVRTAKAVIRGRQISADWHHSYTDAADSVGVEHNRSHQHFIDILKEVLRLLENSQGYAPPEKQKSFPTAHGAIPLAPSRRGDAMSNMFSSPHIEDPLEEAFMPQQTSEPTHTKSASGPRSIQKTSPSKLEFELEEPDDETNFAIWCFLQDLQELRREVRSLWVEYLEGKLSFSAVTEMTANALSLTQYAEKQFVTQYPELWSYDTILEHLGIGINAVGPSVWVCPNTSKGVSDVSSGRVCGNAVAELLCPRAYIILVEFANSLARKLGKESPHLTQDQSYYLGIHPLGEALLTVLPYLDKATLKTLPPLHEDHLIGAARILATDPEVGINTWMIMACQMHMDLYDMMGSDFTHGIREFRCRLASDLASVGNFSESQRCEDAGEYVTYKHACDLATRDLENLARDPFQKKDGTSKATDAKQELAYTVYNVLPIIPGLFINSSAFRTHSFGIKVCNDCCIVLSMAYLYRAARMSGALKSPWKEMDFVIDIQSRKRPFVLESAAGLASMAKCFGLALGVRLQQYAKGRHAPLPKAEYVQQNARRLESWPFSDEEASSNFTDDTILSPSAKSKLDTAIHNLDQLGEADLKGNLDDIYQRYKSNGRITLVQLLSSMKEIFILNEMDLKFDYLTFSKHCSEILIKILTTSVSTMRPVHARFPFDPLLVYEVVYSILCDAAMQQKHQASSRAPILDYVGTVTEQWMQNENACLFKSAQEQTSGHLLTRPVDSLKKTKKSELKSLADETDPDHFMKALGLMSDDAELSKGAFYISKEKSDARMAAYELLNRLRADPDGVSFEAAMETLGHFVILNERDMMSEERAASKQRYVEACRKEGMHPYPPGWKEDVENWMADREKAASEKQTKK